MSGGGGGWLLLLLLIGMVFECHLFIRRPNFFHGSGTGHTQYLIKIGGGRHVGRGVMFIFILLGVIRSGRIATLRVTIVGGIGFVITTTVW